MWILGILLVLGSSKKECRDSLGKFTFFRSPTLYRFIGDFTGVRMYVYPQYELYSIQYELFKMRGSNDAVHYQKK